MGLEDSHVVDQGGRVQRQCRDMSLRSQCVHYWTKLLVRGDFDEDVGGTQFAGSALQRIEAMKTPNLYIMVCA